MTNPKINRRELLTRFAFVPAILAVPQFNLWGKLSSVSKTCKTINYPRKGITAKDVLNQETFDRLTALIFEWQQGPGNFGELTLHATWGITSVLTRRYQGHRCSASHYLIKGSMQMFQRTGNSRWKRLADDIASNLLFLQNAD